MRGDSVLLAAFKQGAIRWTSCLRAVDFLPGGWRNYHGCGLAYKLD